MLLSQELTHQLYYNQKTISSFLLRHKDYLFAWIGHFKGYSWFINNSLFKGNEDPTITLRVIHII